MISADMECSTIVLLKYIFLHIYSILFIQVSFKDDALLLIVNIGWSELYLERYCYSFLNHRISLCPQTDAHFWGGYCKKQFSIRLCPAFCCQLEMVAIKICWVFLKIKALHCLLCTTLKEKNLFILALCLTQWFECIKNYTCFYT